MVISRGGRSSFFLIPDPSPIEGMLPFCAPSARARAKAERLCSPFPRRKTEPRFCFAPGQSRTLKEGIPPSPVYPLSKFRFVGTPFFSFSKKKAPPLPPAPLALIYVATPFLPPSSSSSWPCSLPRIEETSRQKSALVCSRVLFFQKRALSPVSKMYSLGGKEKEPPI